MVDASYCFVPFKFVNLPVSMKVQVLCSIERAMELSESF